MKPTPFLSIFLLCMILISCGRINDDGPITITFDQKLYETTFYKAGQTQMPVITSDLGFPEVSVSPGTHYSISYNDAAEVIEWTEELPLGETYVTVVATVDDMEATTEILINNTFDATFIGGYNFNVSSSLNTSSFNYVDFDRDNTLVLETTEEGVIYRATGTWSMYNNTVEFTYSYDVAPTTFYTFVGNLVYNGIEAYLAGFWYNGAQAGTQDTARGVFRIDFEE